MKFTDGNWMLQPGVQAFYPAQAYDSQIGDDSLQVLATRAVRHRGDTLDGPTLDVHFSSPQDDVIRVQIAHFRGESESGPHFPILETSPKISVEENEDAFVFQSGKLAARVSKTGWNMSFEAEGRVLTSSGSRSLALCQTPTGTYVQEQLSLGVGENVYGLGERFTAFAKNGQVVDIWNRDGGTGSDQAYKNVPFYLTSRGYGVFVNQSENVSFEVASEKVSRVGFSVAGQSLEYFVIYGPTPKAILEKYSALTGRPALPPAWSFGLWLTTSFTTSYDEATVTSFIEGMASRDLPLSVIHFDCFWMREFQWCDFQWDTRVFPDPEGMLARLHERGLKVCVWINPYIAQKSPLFEEGKTGGFLLKKPGGDVCQTDGWQAGMAIVDFTNPAAREWFGDKLRGLLKMGVDSFKTDFGERIPTENVEWFDKSNPQKMHNFYTHLYNQTVFELLEAERGKGEAVLFARSATAGGGQFPVHWGGDNDSTFESMAESLRGGLSLCLSGFGFWSHDIGGFEGTPRAEIYKRWVAFGLLSSHSRLHGSTSYRVPWLFDEEAVEVLRFFTNLKYHLMPYLWAKAVEAHETGIPILRAMLLEFPDDPACGVLDRQYLLGDALLVAPVFGSAGAVEYYVPAGRWTNYLSGEVIEGPGWRRETHDFFSLPLLVRPNSILAVGANEEQPDYEYADDVTFRVYQLEDGREATALIHDPKGKVIGQITLLRCGSTITVNAEGEIKNWRVLLAGQRVQAAPDVRVENGEAGALLWPDASTQHFKVSLLTVPPISGPR
jgi:alpha-D-xyloside xylohydrolase